MPREKPGTSAIMSGLWKASIPGKERRKRCEKQKILLLRALLERESLEKKKVITVQGSGGRRHGTNQLWGSTEIGSLSSTKSIINENGLTNWPQTCQESTQNTGKKRDPIWSSQTNGEKSWG